ncbi:MAG: hypothetical protein ABR575_01510 [Actinomycetota bacterium]
MRGLGSHALSVLVVAAAACSSGPAVDNAVGERTGPPSRVSSPNAGASLRPRADDAGGESRGREGRGGRAARGSGKRDTRTGGATPAVGPSGKGASVPALGLPAGGRYLYDQTGFEEVCQGNCHRERLPRVQPMTVEVHRSQAGAAVVVSDARVSDTRSIRTTTRFTRAEAAITEVVARFSYGTLRFSNTYQPEPAVAALRFPLEPGASWSGRWDARTSGEYRVRVAAREVVSTSAGRIDAFRLQTFTRFEGEFEGTASSVVWVDALTSAIVKTFGEMHLESAFGTFNSKFRTVLSSGPGYR